MFCFFFHFSFNLSKNSLFIQPFPVLFRVLINSNKVSYLVIYRKEISFFFKKKIKKLSIQNLPASITGSKVPFDDALISRLQRGMSLQINYNGSIMRRGIVFLAPSSSPQFMWWQSKTRFVTGEVPVCHSLLHDIDEIRWPSLTLEPVPQFQEWLAKLPFAMKVLLGHPTRGQQRGPRPLTKTPKKQDSLTKVRNHEKSQHWPQEYEIVSPPCEIPTFVKARKVRSDKNTRRGHRNGDHSLDMHAEPPPTDVIEKSDLHPAPPPCLPFVATSPGVFWVRLFMVPPIDPTVPSTATAFLVAPTFGVVDGLKDAVKVKVPEELAGVSVLRLQVWCHEGASNRWQHVDEDTVLKNNNMATSYHVVVLPKE